MSNSPPARRRPPSSSGESGSRPVRKAPSSPRPAPAASGGPKLICLAGPKSGEEYALEGEEEFVLGRATDNAISIPDSSVSRRHAVVRKMGAGWTVGDLGSGNGTLVNGEPLTSEAVLNNGDVIAMGDTELQFSAGEVPSADSTMMMPSPIPSSEATMMIPMPTARPARPAPAGKAKGGGEDEEEAPPARPARPERGAAARPERGAARAERARPGRAGAARAEGEGGANKKRMVLLVVGVLVIAGTGLAVLKAKADAEAEAAAAAAQLEAEQIEQLRGRFQDAKNLIREGKWKEAKEKLAALHAEAPNPDVKAYLDRAEKEIPNEENMLAAQASIDKKELSAARAAISKVTEDTQMFEQRRKLLAALQEAADLQVREAKAMLDNKNPDGAKVITDDVLGAFPEHRDAKIFNDQAVAEIANRNRPVAVITKPDRPWEAAMARFGDGDLSGAVALANACSGKAPRCKQLLDKMTEFGNLYKRVEDLDAKGLSRLLTLDRDITDGRGSKMARSAGTRAANIFYKNATAAKAAGQFGRAVDNAKKALQADPSHTGAKNIMDELKGRAKDVYLSAYSIKDTAPDDALTKFKDVVAMTAPDDEYHQKAKSWIEKLSR
jgi:tetratricopeptide (TPR) repeat protein